MGRFRRPTHQFFSGLFLKKLDDAYNNSDVTYLRYQDDILILCQTKRQLLRCRRRMMEILHERGLTLSRKKSRMGSINQSFHFLGVHYFPTQTENNINITPANDASVDLSMPAHALSDEGGGKPVYEQKKLEPFRIVPHPRTLRKAREQIQCMVADGASLPQTRIYIRRFVMWWVKTVVSWSYNELVESLIQSCWSSHIASIVYGLLQPTLRRNSDTSIDSRALAA